MAKWYAALLKKQGIKITEHKYKAEKGESIADGARSFDSKFESELFDQLKLEQRAGELILVACQEQVELSEAKIVYKPDFTVEEGGTRRWKEAKGFETPEWRIKKRLWAAYGPGPLDIYKKDYKTGRIFIQETIIPKKRTCPHCNNEIL